MLVKLYTAAAMCYVHCKTACLYCCDYYLCGCSMKGLNTLPPCLFKNRPSAGSNLHTHTHTHREIHMSHFHYCCLSHRCVPFCSASCILCTDHTILLLLLQCSVSILSIWVLLLLLLLCSVSQQSRYCCYCCCYCWCWRVTCSHQTL
jgi:hypothetical protein